MYHEPRARSLGPPFWERNPRARELQVATLEQEFPYDYRDDASHLWFFGHGLPGYSWYVPKENGYLNIGVGGMSAQIKSGPSDIHDHWDAFTEDLARGGLVCLQTQRAQLLPARRGPNSTNR